MWQSEENTSGRKANLRDILVDGIRRQDHDGERVSLHNLVAVVAELDPELRHVKEPEWWNPSPSGRNSQHGDHAPPGLQRGVDHLVKVIEYIEKNDTHRKEQTWDPPVFRTHHLWEISDAIRKRSTMKPYLTFKEYLGCFMDLIENEKTPRIESYGFFLRTSVWSQTWQAFTYEKKLLFEMYPAAVESGDPASPPSYHLELADLLIQVNQSMWGCTATDAVACRARIIECMGELELPNWPQTNNSKGALLA
ncbi:hypothetical protein JCM3766R1_003824 [Sporobolomyces carnicolor]